jgi:hypothetical protein
MSKPGQASRETHSGEWLHEYSSFATEINLLTDTNGPNVNRPCREIVVLDPGSGTLVVRMKSRD